MKVNRRWGRPVSAHAHTRHSRPPQLESLPASRLQLSASNGSTERWGWKDPEGDLMPFFYRWGN